MASVFSKIVAGQVPAYKIAENEHFLAFLDVFPLKKGHTLVIPKKEVDDLFDLDNETYLDLMDFAHRIATAIKKAYGCKKVSMQVIGLEVPHAHIHLIPINSMSDCDFTREKLKLQKEEFEEIAMQITARLK